MRWTRRQIYWPKALVIALCLAGCARTPGALAQAATRPIESPSYWAVLPFANHTGSTRAHEMLAPLLEAELARRDVRVMGDDEIRPLLRSRRIRARLGVSPGEARMLAEETGVEALVMGSWDVLSEGANPEIGFSLRVLDLQTLRLTAAVSTGATGEDYRGVLSIGRVTRLEVLAWRAVARGVDELLAPAKTESRRTTQTECGRIALIPIDDYVETVPAGGILLNALLASLVRDGYDVVEPGFVRDLLLTRETASRGGVDLPTSRALYDELGACIVLTGEVDELARAAGDPATTVPRAAFGLRAIHPRTGTIQSVWELNLSGDDHDRILRLGRIHGVIPLVREALADWRSALSPTSR